ncbi:MAG: hypothetical protein AABX54_00345 [Nanoarchaeota archaeon]
MIFQSTALIGLGVIIIAWIIQLAYSWKGNKGMKKGFLIVYAIGVALLIIDGYISDTKDTAIFNLVILVLAMLVLIRLGSKRNEAIISLRPARRKKR